MAIIDYQDIKITQHTIFNSLKEMFSQNNGWIIFEEVRIGTGFKSVAGGRADQRLDGFAFNCWPSKKFESIVFEIKISIQDFKHEISKPYKKTPGMNLSNRFYFVTPKKLLNEELKNMIPKGCGLIEISRKTSIAKIKIEAKERSREQLPINFISSMFRRAFKMEENLKTEHDLKLKLIRNDDWTKLEKGTNEI